MTTTPASTRLGTARAAMIVHLATEANLDLVTAAKAVNAVAAALADTGDRFDAINDLAALGVEWPGVVLRLIERGMNIDADEADHYLELWVADLAGVQL